MDALAASFAGRPVPGRGRADGIRSWVKASGRRPARRSAGRGRPAAGTGRRASAPGPRPEIVFQSAPPAATEGRA